MAQVLIRSTPGTLRVTSADRRRSWLACDYHDTVWWLYDEGERGAAQTISFDVVMPDGKRLPEHPKLYATAKELAFWMRASGRHRMSAQRHRNFIQHILLLCHGLAARDIWSFSDLSTIDIDIICADFAIGTHGLSDIARKTRDFLGRFKSWDQIPPEFVEGNVLNLDAIRGELNIPKRWSALALQEEVASATSRLNGQPETCTPKIKTITVSSVSTLTFIFDALFTLRHLMAAPSIRFRPFKEGPAEKAEELGISSELTPVPQPDLALRLIGEAANHVATHGDAVVGRYQDAIKSRVTGYSPASSADARRDARRLVVGCYILIAAFTARRSGEILKLRRNCLAGNDEYGWWIKVYIEKTSRKDTWTPIPAIVARAVTLLIALDDRAPPSGELFRALCPHFQSRIWFRPERQLNQFAEFVGAVEYSNEAGETKRWSWNTRQFRRFFAVMFIYRYKGKMEALAHHLRHYDLKTTNDYVTLDQDAARIWLREIWSFQAHIAKDLVEGRVTYSGPMGERLNKLVDRVRRKFLDSIVVTPERLAAAVVRAMRSNGLVLVPKPWVTCTCPRTRVGAARATCRKRSGAPPERIGPEFAAAGPSVCPDCPWALIGPENVSFIDAEIEQLEAAKSSLELPTMFSALQEAEVIKLRRFREDLRAG